MQSLGMAPVWAFVREKVPADKTLAYVDTYLTYPLHGFEEQRRVVYRIGQGELATTNLHE